MRHDYPSPDNSLNLTYFRDRRQVLRPQPGHDFAQDDDLRQQWLNQRSNVENAGLTATPQLGGIIEGIYRLDEAQTRSLIEQGFEPSAISPFGTSQDPDNLLAILQDHMTALDAIYSEARRGRSIGRSAIRQLHQVIVAHQPTYRAMNQFGHWFDATLNAGAFKTMPNNPTRPDGVVHQYCPPEHVYSELDHLLSWYGEYTSQPDAYHPLLVAAWLHHRFVRIHPFQDGNGRVTRALVTCHLVERDHLPIVVTRDDRNDYVDTLEAPDDGDLNPTVEFTSRLHRGSMLQAMSACVLPRED